MPTALMEESEWPAAVNSSQALEMQVSTEETSSSGSCSCQLGKNGGSARKMGFGTHGE
jgi:hypothetical protein